MRGLEGMLEFLSFLRDKNITFTIANRRYDSVMVSFTLVGVRVEVDFFVDGMEFSYFKGSEEVHTDKEELMALIAENWD